MTTERPTPVEIRRLEAADLDAAAALLADRHRRHRLAEPLLDPAFEDPDAARREIEAMLAVEGAGGWVAVRNGSVAGYLVGFAKDAQTWGPNVWVESAGHAAAEPTLVRELYAVAAESWVAEGRANHHVLVPASDKALVDAWFSLDFGQQHLHAVRELPTPDFGVVPRSELVVRRARPEDLDALTELESVLPDHMRGAPVFSRLQRQPADEIRAELESDLADPAYTYFVAEHEGAVIGTAIACSLEVSSGNAGLIRPANAGFLGYAAVLAAGRGLGAGKALGETVMAWARDEGYASVATDWRSANIEADRTWRRLGFRPTFRRLHRAIT
jgi:GNAT superfamily N-acetyltransferase